MMTYRQVWILQVLATMYNMFSLIRDHLKLQQKSEKDITISAIIKIEYSVKNLNLDQTLKHVIRKTCP